MLSQNSGVTKPLYPRYMKSPNVKRQKYRTPDAKDVSLYYDCIISESLLETVIEGEEWIWEE